MSEGNSKNIYIKRVNTEQVKPTFVNDVIVTHTDDEFFITFSQIEGPAILSEEEMESLSSIDAIAQSKLVVTPAFFKRILNAFETNYKNYLNKNDIERNE